MNWRLATYIVWQRGEFASVGYLIRDLRFIANKKFIEQTVRKTDD